MIRANAILAIVAAVLAVPVVITYRSVDRDFTDYAEVPLLLDGFSEERVMAMRVTVPQRDETGQLRRADGEVVRDVLEMRRDPEGGWQINKTKFDGAALRTDRIRTAILEPLLEIRRDEKALVERDCPPDQLARYGLDVDSATLIECFDRDLNPIARLMKGSDASEGKVGDDVVQGFYVRLADYADVVLYERQYWQVTASVHELLERNLLKFDPDAAVRLEVANAAGEFVVEKDQAVDVDWKLVEFVDRKDGTPREKVGHPKVSELAGLLQTITFTGVQQYLEPLDPADPQTPARLEKLGFAQPRATVRVTVADGPAQKVHALTVGAKLPGKNEYYLHIEDVPFLLSIGDWVIAPFERGPMHYFDPATLR